MFIHILVESPPLRVAASVWGGWKYSNMVALKHPRSEEMMSRWRLEAPKVGVPESSEVVLGRLWGQDALPKATSGGQIVAQRMPKGGFGRHF